VLMGRGGLAEHAKPADLIMTSLTSYWQLARFTDLSPTGCGTVPPAVFRPRSPQFGKWPPMGVRDGPSSGSGIGELKKSAPGPPPVVL
jgi:hypothetical protein